MRLSISPFIVQKVPKKVKRKAHVPAVSGGKSGYSRKDGDEKRIKKEETKKIAGWIRENRKISGAAGCANVLLHAVVCAMMSLA
jgi:hypothetical protein